MQFMLNNLHFGGKIPLQTGFLSHLPVEKKINHCSVDVVWFSLIAIYFLETGRPSFIYLIIYQYDHSDGSSLKRSLELITLF